ncbi:MAG TPA: hypothetical protein VEI53_03215, partial [Ktedonobacteraceae bacterium]|nr:hypothetical protein [Ktedonobacteraceae bacterium]
GLIRAKSEATIPAPGQGRGHHRAPGQGRGYHPRTGQAQSLLCMIQASRFSVYSRGVSLRSPSFYGSSPTFLIV